MGKARLTPIKPITVPQMELSAAVAATRPEKISRRVKPTNQLIILLDRQHLCPALPRESRQAIQNILRR